jgi:diguanylate cyclase (GGDEF)-like protein
MREYLDASVFFNWVVMLRADIDGAIWLADDDEEGRFYERCAHPSGRVVPTPKIAVEVLRHVAENGTKGVVATVRHVFDEQQGISGSIFRPSIGDVASLLVLSQSCIRVIEGIGGVAWLRVCEKDVGSIRSKAIAVACFLERLGEACTSAGVAALSPGDFANYIAWDALDVDWLRVGEYFQDRGLSMNILEGIRNLRYGTDPYADIALCDGMNVVAILALSTKWLRPRGISAIREVKMDEFVSMVRIAFDLEELTNDSMFWRMRRWERQNIRYPLLRNWRTLDPLGVVTDQRYWERDLGLVMLSLESDEQIAIFKMDLDNFRNVNNALGHSAGDDAIRLYCTIVKEVLGSTGEIYRRGGDEIVVLAPRLDAEDAARLGEALRSEVESQFRAWAKPRGLDEWPTASIGLVFTKGRVAISEVIARMDAAQHEAKRQGKNRLVIG